MTLHVSRPLPTHVPATGNSSTTFVRRLFNFTKLPTGRLAPAPPSQAAKRAGALRDGH